MQARFKLRTGGPRSLTVRGIRYEADRIYTTTKPGMVAFLKGRPEFTFLSIKGEDDKPEPAPKKSAPNKGGLITSADLKTSDNEPADDPEPEQVPEPKKKPAKKKTTKKRTTKKRTRKK